MSNPRLIESLDNVLASRQDDSSFLSRDGCETLSDNPALFLAHTGAQGDNVIDYTRRQFTFQAVEMVVALGQYQRRTCIPNRVDDVLADSPRSSLVIDRILIHGLKFDALVRSRACRRLECCGLNEHEMLEGRDAAWSRVGKLKGAG